eukprot:322293-Rhodomonas_salina.2
MWLAISTSAPCCSSRREQSSLPASTARSRAVLPSCRKPITVKGYYRRCSNASAQSPVACHGLYFAGWSTSRRSTLRCPAAAASMSAVTPPCHTSRAKANSEPQSSNPKLSVTNEKSMYEHNSRQTSSAISSFALAISRDCTLSTSPVADASARGVLPFCRVQGGSQQGRDQRECIG